MVRSQVVTLRTKGRFVLPRAVRAASGPQSGSTLAVALEPDGTITARPVRGKLQAFFQAMDGLASAGPLEVDAAIMDSVTDRVPQEEGWGSAPAQFLGSP